MKQVAIVIIGCLLAHITPPAIAATPPFPDMRTSWYEYQEAVDVLQTRGVIGGYPNGMFKPQQTINRAEFLKIVFAAKDSGGGTTEGACFSDVPHDAWFAPFVCAAAKRDIAKGYPDGTFKPEQEVNWAEAIALITRTYGWQIDERTGENWYKPFVVELDQKHVLAEHSYVPWATLSRERAADLVYRMLQYDRGQTLEESPGCRNGDGDVPATVTVNGVERTFLITIPAGAKKKDPTPILFAFHGRTNSNERVKSYMRFEREATDMIVVYPAAIKNGSSYSWAGDGGADLAFFDALVKTIGTHLCVDKEKIYVTGHSLGAWMANSVACLRGGVVRASGTVGGDGIATGCTGPTAALLSHNPHDTLAPFASTERVREKRVAINACSWVVKATEPKNLLCVTHTGCAGGNDILWCPHEIDTDERGDYYPHTWPRGTAKSIVAFFQGLDD